MRVLYTSEGENLRGTPWNVYPRPQLRRDRWLCLNGSWNFQQGSRSGSILVPFCPESPLSGIGEVSGYGEEMIYRRDLEIPPEWVGFRILLHFGAVNRRAEVALNGTPLYTHENGYLPFTVELTQTLRPGKNLLEVRAVNDISPRHPWGKQKIRRGGMWYTPVSGIWQTVWMEAVPADYIRSLKIRTDLNQVRIETEGPKSGTVLLDGREYPLEEGCAVIRISQPRLWSPEDPFLYPFTVICGEDRVHSYFALRTLSVEMVGGRPRLCLNAKPYFFHGILDQGYWSDGLYTPPSPECFEKDILAMKALGFNTLRKHIKIEPEQFYYDCDRLGMVVFQDMVNCGTYRYLRDTVLPTIGFQRRRDLRLNRDPATRENFRKAMTQTVRLLDGHPCILLWTIFNEGWGQFCADDMYDLLRTLDDTRWIDSTSGWFHQQKSDVESLHIYFSKLALGTKPLPQFLSEFGGYSLKIADHSVNLEKNYGYRDFQDREAYVRALNELYRAHILPMVREGLSGAVYTQVSDVEDETNGLLTYDRRVQKITPEEFAPVADEIRKIISALCQSASAAG